MDPHVAANRDLWDSWVDLHAGSSFYDLEGFRRGDVRLDPMELAEIGDVGGRSLLHLQCHFGIDTLSWARLGARPTGVDFSPKAIELARSLAGELGLDAHFVCSTVDDLPGALDDQFDVVYTSNGVLGWLPDLRRWGDVIARFVRPGGFFYIWECHPTLWMFDGELRKPQLRVRYPYFEQDAPLHFCSTGSYAEPLADITSSEYGWIHSLSEIVTALIDAGLRVEFLHEHRFLAWPFAPFCEQREHGRWYLPDDLPAVPQSFSLRAVKSP